MKHWRHNTIVFIPVILLRVPIVLIGMGAESLANLIHRHEHRLPGFK